MKKYTKGFTLIELLVVIAIIGILSSVVLASLSSARGKGNDAAIKTQLTALRSQAAIFLDATTSSAYLSNDPTIQKIITAVSGNSGAVIFATTTGSADWAASSKLNTTPVTYFCVDSSGNAMATGTIVYGGATKCF